SLLQRIRFETAETIEEKFNCIQCLHEMISQSKDPVGIVIPVHDLWEMLKIPLDNMPEEISPTVLRNEFIKILDRAAEEKPTHDIISIRDEIKGDNYR
ncbi:MAG: hypothetical protein KAQ97_07345, partial [Candidatus Fermentibacteraceae bacterium]|nr:hypothetical protein [Candidatus Fermentibacteraceae bacterium]